MTRSTAGGRWRAGISLGLGLLLGGSAPGCLPEGRVDADGDGFAREDDCDDDDAAISPDGAERCGDGVDDDCDGTADEGFDEDGDGFLLCATTAAQADCDDGDPDVSPGGTEVCANGVDDDCDGATDTLEDAFEPNNSAATASYLGSIEEGPVEVDATVYLSTGADVRDAFLVEAIEHDPEDPEAFSVTARLTDIPDGLDLDLEIAREGASQTVSDPRPGNADETVVFPATRVDDSGGYVITVKLVSKTDTPGAECRPYHLWVGQEG